MSIWSLCDIDTDEANGNVTEYDQKNQKNKTQ